ncbi:putative nicotinate-nucleotide adenylyltransferase [Sulfitobacter noctilucicola]|uniref:Probable nicotinate-nucleotide adenylyltransferase n=1 Tax=Sulfitobacter noctilucicola TaxID=1342301 RepID=A0A7W6MBR7_9RHOB|nr:nicotinate-nucleotide adenylyltransferase [Sulfitobacter noctilucicola]KIN63321.1 putative nicotinate-nucleotide adenylyltransferase [Sulfitobacter noctilucicola]MBB4175161.1 nicotinate-nucleotide adenylyltransferase [Sulfitobacter noctilucicola]
MRYQFPYAGRGQVIGLLGGSFDPAHEGHAHITREALKRFGLDRVWWLVSPGNPLKSRGPAPLEDRLERAAAVMRHPKVDITDIEAHLGTRYTAQTLQKLRRMYPDVRFVWLMGADNMAQFHLWQDWRQIMETVPIGVLARPGQRISARMSRAAALYAPYRIPGRFGQLLGHATAPAWSFVNVPMNETSSTAIRASGAWSTQSG